MLSCVNYQVDLNIEVQEKVLKDRVEFFWSDRIEKASRKEFVVQLSLHMKLYLSLLMKFYRSLLMKLYLDQVPSHKYLHNTNH